MSGGLRKPPTVPYEIVRAELSAMGHLEAIELIAKRHGVAGLRALRGSDRHKRVARARHEAMAYLTHHTTLSSTEIGRVFDREHTTILAAVKKMEALRALELPAELAKCATPVNQMRVRVEIA